MPKLYGKSFTRAELTERGGDMRQFAGVRLGELGDGFERGVRTVDFRTGSGFDFTVLADRGLDIGAANFNGAALAWQSPTPYAHPAFYEPDGLGWLRGFGGGLMTTCGLTYFGAPNVDEGQPLGLHGRASNLAATHLAYGADWHGDEYELWVSGQIREVRFFGENVVLRRRISAWLGSSRLVVEDAVTNEGYETTPHMMLYHCNLGYPVLSEDSELLIDDAEVYRARRSLRGRAARPSPVRPAHAGLRRAGVPARPADGRRGLRPGRAGQSRLRRRPRAGRLPPLARGRAAVDDPVEADRPGRVRGGPGAGHQLDDRPGGGTRRGPAEVPGAGRDAQLPAGARRAGVAGGDRRVCGRAAAIGIPL